MTPRLKTTLLAALPLAGLLFAAPPAALAKHHHHHCWSKYDRYSYEGPYDEDDYAYGDYPSTPYGYGERPYYGAGPYPAPYEGGPYANPSPLGPDSLLPALLGSLLSGY